MDFRYFEKWRYRPGELARLQEFDLLISGFNLTDRVRLPFSQIPAKKKRWMVFPEYQVGASEHPQEAVELEGEDEAEAVATFCDRIGLLNVDRGAKICIDCSGIIRPYLLVLLRWLEIHDFQVLYVLYNEPECYSHRELTEFSGGALEELDIRPVMGFEGSPTQSLVKHLVLGGGYEHRLISHLASNKESARKTLVLGFPSSRPEMYQESVLCAHRAKEALGGNPEGRFWYSSSAYDPFDVANTLGVIVLAERIDSTCNLYLAPVGSKPQALGFFLFYLASQQSMSITMLYPFSKRYSSDVALGYTRSWLYEIELGEIKKSRLQAS